MPVFRAFFSTVWPPMRRPWNCQRPLVLVAVLLLLCGWTAPSRAQAQRQLSAYEKETVRLSLEEVGGVQEPDPEGKLIESVEVVTFEVFEPRDPAPGFLNWFHVTTQENRVEREVLQRVGEPYDSVRSAETERNLRALSQLSLVLVIPLKGSAPDRVKLLVITKDVWSLRLNWEPRFVNGKLDFLALQPSETNLFGTTNSVRGNFVFTPQTHTVGLGLTLPRIAGSRVVLSADASAVINCDSGDIEGSTGNFFYGQPLYSTRAKWSWLTYMAWDERVVRPSNTTGQWICSGGKPQDLTRVVQTGEAFGGVEPVLIAAIPDEYRRESWQGQSVITRSFGVARKTDVSFGGEAQRTAARAIDQELPPESFFVVLLEEGTNRYFRDVNGNLAGAPALLGGNELAAAQQAARDEYRRARIPTPNVRISPFFQVHSYTTRFQRYINYNTLGLQEDMRLGPDAYLRFYPAWKALGSTRTLMGTFASLGYTLPVSTGLMRARASTRIELATVHEDTQAEFYWAYHFAAPAMRFGRFVYDFRWTHREVNALNFQNTLGGTGRLRGYSPIAIFGQHLVTQNIEFRTAPLRMFNVLAGGVLFYDAGDAFNRFESRTESSVDRGAFNLRHGAGFGLRFLAPQLDRSVFRADLGFPLDPKDPDKEITFFAGFGQAFGAPGVPSPALLPQ